MNTAEKGKITKIAVIFIIAIAVGFLWNRIDKRVETTEANPLFGWSVKQYSGPINQWIPVAYSKRVRFITDDCEAVLEYRDPADPSRYKKTKYSCRTKGQGYFNTGVIPAYNPEAPLNKQFCMVRLVSDQDVTVLTAH